MFWHSVNTDCFFTYLDLLHFRQTVISHIYFRKRKTKMWPFQSLPKHSATKIQRRMLLKEKHTVVRMTGFPQKSIWKVCCSKSENIKSPGSATITSRSQHPTPRVRGKEKSNACKINIQLHEKHIDQLALSSPSEVITMLKRTEKKWRTWSKVRLNMIASW